MSLYSPPFCGEENALRQREEISCHAQRPAAFAVLGSGLAVGRVLCRAQGLGTAPRSPGQGGVSAWGKKKGNKSCSSSCASGAAARGASPAPCGMCWACGSLWRSKGSTGAAEAGAGDSSEGCCVTLGGLSSHTVPCPGDPGEKPLVRGLFPSFSHSHSALGWFGAAWCLPCCVSSVCQCDSCHG